MLRRLLWISLFAAVGQSLHGQTNLATLGPQVGQRAIEFSLPDQVGRARTLQSAAGPKGTMLMFFRSADW